MLSKSQLVDSRFFMVFVAGLAALGALAVNMYLPALPDMAKSLRSDMAAANLTVSTFLIGMAFGQFIGGPLSDQLGRKTIGVAGLIIFILASIGIVLAMNIYQVQLLRVIQATGAGFASVVCMAQARDVFARDVVMLKYANILVVMLLAPMLAPTLGAFLTPLGWRAIFFALIVFATMMVCLYVLVIPETHTSRSGRLNASLLVSGYVAATMRRTDGRLLALRYVLFTGCSSGILFAYVTNASFIFIEYFEFTPLVFSVVFGLMAGLMMIGNRLATIAAKNLEPQQILHVANGCQIILALGLVVLCAIDMINVWNIGMGLGLIIVASGAISPIASGYYISLHEDHIGSAASLNSSIMFAFGAFIGALAAILSAGQLLPVFGIMLTSAIMARLIFWSASRQPLNA